MEMGTGCPKTELVCGLLFLMGAEKAALGAPVLLNVVRKVILASYLFR